jgi:hypothetical protein
MSMSAEFARRVAEFPIALRELIAAELSAGNRIVEVASCFPAPPAGAYVKLAQPVTTRARTNTAQVDFYDRNTSLYSGEWTDGRRFFFVLEPPHPPEPEPDMDAIRAAQAGSYTQPRTAKPAQRGAVPGDKLERSEFGVPTARSNQRPGVKPLHLTGGANSEPDAAPADSVVERFRRSMAIDYEKWHDGIGYDVALLSEVTPADRLAIESLLLSRGVNDWRDVEALATLRTERAKRALHKAMISGKTEIRAAVIRHAPKLVCEEDKIAFLVEALRTAQFYGGLTQALDEVASFYPPEIVTELFRGALERRGDVAVHFAAMLMFIHGQTKQPFDWEHRPFFLRFDTSTRAEREQVFRELCARVEVNPEAYLIAH